MSDLAASVPLIDDAVSELAITLRQLRFHLEHVHEEPTLVRDISNAVRKLITGGLKRKDKTPLLLVVAGQVGAGLIVYGTGDDQPMPVDPITFVPAPFSALPPGSPGAIGGRFRMDLEAWLRLEGGAIDRERMSNEDFVLAIADKIGAHADLVRRRTVQTLQAGKQGDSGLDDLELYVVRLGQSTLQLGEQLLADMNGGETPPG